MNKLNPDLFIDLYQQLLSVNFDSPEEQCCSISKYVLSGREPIFVFSSFTSKAQEVDTETKLLKNGSIRPGRILFPDNVSFPLDKKHKFLMFGKFYYIVGKSIKKLKLMKIKYLPDELLRGLKDNPGLELLRFIQAKPLIPLVIKSVKSFDELHCSFMVLQEIKNLIPDLQIETLFLDVGEVPLFDILKSDTVATTKFQNFRLGYNQTITYFPGFCLKEDTVAEKLFGNLKKLRFESTDLEFHRKRIKPEYFHVFKKEIFRNLEELKVEYSSKFKGNALRTFTTEKAKNLQNVFDEFCTELIQFPEKLKVEMKGKHIFFPLHSRRPEQENVLPFVSILNKVLRNFTFEATEEEFYGKQYSWKIRNQLTDNKVFEFSVSVFQFDRERYIRELEAQAEEDKNLPNYSSSENEEDDEEMLIDKKVDDFDLDPPGSEDNSEFDDDSDDEDFEI